MTLPNLSIQTPRIYLSCFFFNKLSSDALHNYIASASGLVGDSGLYYNKQSLLFLTLSICLSYEFNAVVCCQLKSWEGLFPWTGKRIGEETMKRHAGQVALKKTATKSCSFLYVFVSKESIRNSEPLEWAAVKLN